MLLQFLTFLSIKLNTFLEKRPLIIRMACIYFDITSRITHFLLFNFIIYITIYITGVYMITAHFMEIQCFLHKLHLSELKSFYLAYQECLSFQLKCTLFFLFSLIEIALINTVLASTPIISEYMKNKYHENILKDRGYNSFGNTLKKVGVIVSGVVVAYGVTVAADVEKFKIGATEYSKSYKEYVLASSGQNIQPPQPILTMEVTEGVQKVIDFSIKK